MRLRVAKTIATTSATVAALSFAWAYANPIPWVGVLIGSAAVLILPFIFISRSGERYLIACCIGALIALALFELTLGLKELRGDETVVEGSISDGFTQRNDLLGYAPPRAHRVTARKRFKDQVIYDVVYTIGENGLRIAPPT